MENGKGKINLSRYYKTYSTDKYTKTKVKEPGIGMARSEGKALRDATKIRDKCSEKFTLL